MKNKRVAGLDIIRALAAIFVVSVHYLLNTNFYSMNLSGKGMIILTFLRHFLLTCVPLFLLLTGYLNRNKEPNKEYYKGLIKVLISYIFISVACIIVRKYYFGEEQGLLSWIASIFNFTANGYSWYIEMYIGLFFLIPYLNILYKSLDTKKKKQGLIATFIIITTLPSIINGVKILDSRLFALPDWWINLYPVTYYFIGTYIAEYKPKLTIKKNIIYIVLVTLIHTLVYWIINQGGRFYKPFMGQYHNILTMILSVLIFLFFYEKDIKNNQLKKLVTTISLCSLDIYLISYLVDLKIYSIIKPLTNNPKEHLLYMIPTILVVFVTSFILAYIKNMLFNIIEKSKKGDKKMQEKTDKVVTHIKNTGVHLLLFLTILIIISSLGHLFNFNIIKYNVYISFILSSVFLYILNKKDKITYTIIPLIISIIFIVIGVIINQNFLDLSWDGNSYHKDAVGLIKNGWNPIYDDYIEYYKELGNRNMDYIGDKVELTHGFWQTYYAKSTWHIGASFYALTNNIESGKIYNIIGIFITFSLTLYILYKITNKAAISTIIALLLSINPISLVQCFTYYNDGFMGNLLMTLIVCMTVFALDKKETNKKELYVVICSLLLILINIKFTGFGYAGIFCVPYFLVFMYKKLKEKNTKELIKSTSIFIITVLFSVCIVGYSPYITNLKEGLPIFYPLMGENKVDIVTHNQTIQFNNKSTLYKFSKSMLSEVSNANQASGLKPQIKIPFTASKAEKELLRYPDLRISGFGVLFGGIFVISITIILFIILKEALNKNKNIIYVVIPILTSAILVLVISESWWARYSPYVYIIPIITLSLTAYKKDLVNRIISISIFILLIINMSYFFEYNILNNFNKSNQIINRIESLKNKDVIIIDRDNEFLGIMYNFEDKDIRFTITKDEKPNSRELYRWIKYKEVK